MYTSISPTGYDVLSISLNQKEVARNGQLFKICQMLFDGEKEADEGNRKMQFL
jgi:hypothetical protein